MFPFNFTRVGWFLLDWRKPEFWVQYCLTQLKMFEEHVSLDPPSLPHTLTVWVGRKRIVRTVSQKPRGLRLSDSVGDIVGCRWKSPDLYTLSLILYLMVLKTVSQGGYGILRCYFWNLTLKVCFHNTNTDIAAVFLNKLQCL